MRTWLRWALIGGGVVVAGAVGYWFGHRGGGAAAGAAPETGAGADDGPVAAVVVVPIRRGRIDENVTAYGTVVSQLGDIRAVSVAFESRVNRVFVSPGQPVKPGTPLVEVGPSAATGLALQEAQNAVAAAERDLAQVRERYAQKLATNQELNTAEATLQSARARLQSLLDAGAGGPQQLKADVAGVVSKINVQVGQVVPAGTSMVDVAAENRIEVRLGVETGDAPHLKPEQPVRLVPVVHGGAAPIAGHVRLVTQQVNPATRLVDVFVALPPDANLLLETFVRAELVLRSADGLLVPRDAALPDGEAYTLFTVENGRAVRHTVRVGIDGDREVQVEGADLHEGQLVVSSGNYELQNGMRVSAQLAAAPPPTNPAAPASAPASQPGEEAAR